MPDRGADAGVLELEGRARPLHPPADRLDPLRGSRRLSAARLHGRLAATVTDPEEHARHAALAAPRAIGRGSATSLDIAARHRPAARQHRRGRRAGRAGHARTPASATSTISSGGPWTRPEYLFLLGDPARARTVLDAGLDAAPPGPLRVRGLLLQASIASWESGDATVAAWCEQAIAEAGADPLLLARVPRHAGGDEPVRCRAGPVPRARAPWTCWRQCPLRRSDLLSNALTNVALHGCRLGRGLEVATLERAVALAGPG